MAIAEGPDGRVNSLLRSFPYSRASILERWPKAKAIEGFEPDGEDPSKRYQVNDLLDHDKRVAAVALCDQCLRGLKYADARTWEWFRRYRDRLSQGK